MLRKPVRIAVAILACTAALGSTACSNDNKDSVSNTSTAGAKTTMAQVKTNAQLPSVGQVWLADFGDNTPFGPFAAKLSFTSRTELTFEVTKGGLTGSTDTMPYTTTEVASGVYVVRWHEPKSGSYVTHVEDYNSHTVVSSIVSGDQFVEMDGTLTPAD